MSTLAFELERRNEGTRTIARLRGRLVQDEAGELASMLDALAEWNRTHYEPEALLPRRVST